ncbi:MAG: hypothetical protein LAO19_03475 [Acidobacteriia bacterium]|nr:hypothetical protein [Terriglobia bacterium]
MFIINPPVILKALALLDHSEMLMQLEVFGFLHYTHPAATKLRENTILRNGFADHSEIILSIAGVPFDASLE